MKFNTNIIIVVLLLVAGKATAQGPPIFTETPIMLGLDGGGVRTFGKFIARENAHVYVQPIIVPYNIKTIWQVGAVGPFVNVAPDDGKSRFGLSDVSIFTKLQLHHKDGRGKTFRTILKIKETIPTGNTSEQPALGANAWQTQVGLVTGYVTIKYGIYAEVAYNITTNGLPDNLIYNLAFGYPLLPQKYPPKQLNVFLELNGILLTDSGRNALFISPGLQFIPGSRFLVETGIQLPLAQNAPEPQKTNFMYTLGIRVLIF